MLTLKGVVVGVFIRRRCGLSNGDDVMKIIGQKILVGAAGA